MPDMLLTGQTARRPCRRSMGVSPHSWSDAALQAAAIASWAVDVAVIRVDYRALAVQPEVNLAIYTPQQ
jgi:hypothetical protein